MEYQDILVETHDRVALIRLNRLQRLNALNDALADEFGNALRNIDAEPAIGCVVIAGSEKAFAAGADIGAMAEWSHATVYNDNYTSRNWDAIRQIHKPVIAAVAGYALGGGCELAMACDTIVAADTAKLGQPEIPTRRDCDAAPQGPPGRREPAWRSRAGARLGPIERPSPDADFYWETQVWSTHRDSLGSAALVRACS